MRRIVAARPPASGAPTFVAIDTRTGNEFFRLERQPVRKLAALLYPAGDLPHLQKRPLPTRYAVSELNADGISDLILAHPGHAELVVFMGEPGGFRSPQTYPTFSALSSMASGRFLSAAMTR